MSHNVGIKLEFSDRSELTEAWLALSGVGLDSDNFNPPLPSVRDMKRSVGSWAESEIGDCLQDRLEELAVRRQEAQP